MEKSTPIFGISFVCSEANELAEMISRERIPSGQGVRAIYTANLDHIVRLHESAEFKNAYKNAWAATVDGWPVALAAKLIRGTNVPRITGSDLFPKLADHLNPDLHRLFFLVSSHQTAAAVQQKFSLRGFERERIACVVPPFGFENDSHYCQRLIDEIKSHSTTHLFLGLGAPKSEIWIYRHRQGLGDLYAACFGAAFDFFAETRLRAPLPLRKIGMEWAWRLMLEPRRLAGRYFFGAFRFVYLLRHM